MQPRAPEVALVRQLVLHSTTWAAEKVASVAVHVRQRTFRLEGRCFLEASTSHPG